MIELLGQTVVREVVKEIRDNGIFAILVDGTQDTSGIETRIHLLPTCQLKFGRSQVLWASKTVRIHAVKQWQT